MAGQTLSRGCLPVFVTSPVALSTCKKPRHRLKGAPFSLHITGNWDSPTELLRNGNVALWSFFYSIIHAQPLATAAIYSSSHLFKAMMGLGKILFLRLRSVWREWSSPSTPSSVLLYLSLYKVVTPGLGPFNSATWYKCGTDKKEWKRNGILYSVNSVCVSLKGLGSES